MANRLLVIRVLPNGMDRSRFGFVVSKRIGGAVVRNKVKRRLREAVRLTPVKAGWDALFIARRGVEQADYQQLKQATENLLRRAHLIASTDPEAAHPGRASRLPVSCLSKEGPKEGPLGRRNPEGEAR
jgi:ribonuclease P protein component